MAAGGVAVVGGESPTRGGLDFYLTLHAATSPATVALSIYRSDESRRARVQGIYRSLLDRSTDAGGEGFSASRLFEAGDDLVLAAELASSVKYYEKATR